jgi:pilus assembly protein CpaD
MSKDLPIMSRARVWFSVAALATLAACASAGDRESATAAQPALPTERYSIDVGRGPEVLRLSAHADGLSQNQQSALRVVAGRWVDGDHGDLSIKTPANPADPGGAFRTAKEASRYLVSQGVDESRIHAGEYASDDPKAPIVISFSRYEATGPKCGRAWSNIAVDHSDEPYPEFGCSITANVAAQVADSEDLIHPRAEDPSDAGRRDSVIGTYRQGGDPSSAVNSQANGGLTSAF